MNNLYDRLDKLFSGYILNINVSYVQTRIRVERSVFEHEFEAKNEQPAGKLLFCLYPLCGTTSNCFVTGNRDKKRRDERNQNLSVSRR